MIPEPRGLTLLRSDLQWNSYGEALSEHEARELVAYIDALQAAVAPRSSPSYKGVTYDRSCSAWRYDGCVFDRAADVVSRSHRDFDDYDHAAILALRDAPQPVTVESVVAAWDREDVGFDRNYSEALALLCARLRAAGFDAPREPVSNADELPRHLTAAECVSRLVDLGAKRHVPVTVYEPGAYVAVYKEADVLVLPTEVAQ